MLENVTIVEAGVGLEVLELEVSEEYDGELLLCGDCDEDDGVCVYIAGGMKEQEDSESLSCSKQ